MKKDAMALVTGKPVYTDDIAPKDCLADILQKNRSEVVDMILTEYDEEEFRRAWREDLLNEGFRKGLNNGLSKGIKGTIHACMKFNVPKEDVMQNLMEEFSLSQEEAEKYLEEYWK